jgi:hypothetical protein
VFEDHTFQERLDNLLFLGRKLRDSFKLEAEIAIGAAFVGAEDQHICTHLQSDREPSNYIQRGLRGAALIAAHLNHMQVDEFGQGLSTQALLFSLAADVL